MKHLRKLLSLTLVLLFVISAASAVCASAADAPAAFVPVMRFVAASDTHVRDGSDMTPTRTIKSSTRCLWRAI